MNQAFHLYRLQQIDTQIDQVEAQLAEIDRLLAGDEAVKQARQLCEQAGKELHQASHDLKQAEFAVREVQIKIAQSESTLYSGKVRNPKELQDLEKEIASLKKHLSSLEDRQLEAMVTLEDSENQNDASQKSFEQAQATFAERSAGWLGKKESLTRNLERLHAERSAVIAPILPDAIKTYDAIRKRKSGVAVTTAQEGSCTVCGATIRPSEIQTARSAQGLVFCTSCGRVLYAV